MTQRVPQSPYHQTDTSLKQLGRISKDPSTPSPSVLLRTFILFFNILLNFCALKAVFCGREETDVSEELVVKKDGLVAEKRFNPVELRHINFLQLYCRQYKFSLIDENMLLLMPLAGILLAS